MDTSGFLLILVEFSGFWWILVDFFDTSGA